MDTRRPRPFLLSLISVSLLTLVACQGESSWGTMQSSEVASLETTRVRALGSGSAPSSEIGRTEKLVGSWVLASGSADEKEIPTEPELILRVEEGRFYFPLACNSASVPYEVSGASIELDNEGFATTEESCASVQADLFELALLQTRSLSMDSSEGTLTLVGADVSLLFDRLDP